jgi:small neutral amino acid transporter SnatA (MarC family)
MFALLTPVIMVADKVFAHGVGKTMMQITSYLIALAIPAWIWYRRGLVPSVVRNDRRRRYRVGHVLLAIPNITVPIAFIAALLYATTSNQSAAAFALFTAVAMVYGIPLWISGLICIYTSADRSGVKAA